MVGRGHRFDRYLVCGRRRVFLESWAYVTDDERGQLDTLSLRTRRVVNRLYVGPLAHHLSVSPNGRELWVALSETATTIVTVDLSDPARPRLSGRFDPG